MSLLYALPLLVASCVMRQGVAGSRGRSLVDTLRIHGFLFISRCEAQGARYPLSCMLSPLRGPRAGSAATAGFAHRPDEALVVAALSDAHSILSRATPSSDDVVLRARYEQRDCIVDRGLGGSLSAARAGACRWSARRPFARARTGMPLPAQLAAAAALARLEEPSPSRASRSTRSAASA